MVNFLGVVVAILSAHRIQETVEHTVNDAKDCAMHASVSLPFKRGSGRGLVGDQEGIRGVFRGSGPLGEEIASAIPRVSEGIR